MKIRKFDSTLTLDKKLSRVGDLYDLLSKYRTDTSILIRFIDSATIGWGVGKPLRSSTKSAAGDAKLFV